MATSPLAYSGFATILSGVFGNYDEAVELGEFARELALKYNHKDQICRVEHLVWCFIKNWKSPVRDCLNGIIKAFRTGLESGEYEFAIHAINMYSFYAFYVGQNLNSLTEEMREYRRIIGDLNHDHLLPHIEMYRQGIANLMEGSDNLVALCGQQYNEKKHVAYIERTKDFHFYMAVMKVILAYTYKQDLQGITWVKKCYETQGAAIGSYAIPTFMFYEALIRLRLLRNQRSKLKLLEKFRINRILRKTMSWMEHCPQNHYHRYLIIKGKSVAIRDVLKMLLNS